MHAGPLNCHRAAGWEQTEPRAAVLGPKGASKRTKAGPKLPKYAPFTYPKTRIMFGQTVFDQFGGQHKTGKARQDKGWKPPKPGGCTEEKCPRNRHSGRPPQDMAFFLFRHICAKNSHKCPKRASEGAQRGAAVPQLRAMRAQLATGSFGGARFLVYGSTCILGDLVAQEDELVHFVGGGQNQLKFLFIGSRPQAARFLRKSTLMANNQIWVPAPGFWLRKP